MRQLKKKSILMAAAGTVCLAGYAQAATVSWIGPVGNPWSLASDWDTAAVPAATDAVYFGDAGVAPSAGTVTSIVDADLTISSLSYTPLTTTGYHTTQINTGATLSITGTGDSGLFAQTLWVGSGTDAGNTAEAYASITGAGSLVIDDAGGDITIRQGTTGSGGSRRATLDLSTLARFTATIDDLQIGQGGGSSTPEQNRGTGTLYLAPDSTVNADEVVVGYIQASSGGQSQLFFGADTKINASTVTVGRRKGSGLAGFGPSVAGGTVKLRARDGAGRTNFEIGATQVGDSTTASGSGVVDLTVGSGTLGSGSIDALVDTLLIGRGGGGTSVHTGSGRLTYAAGAIDANTVIVGDNGSNGTHAGTGNGTLQVNGTAVLQVNSQLILANLGAASTTVGAANANLSIDGGAVKVAGNVVDGGGTSTISLSNNGSLRATKIGDATNRIESFTINNGTIGIALDSGAASLVADAFSADGVNKIALGTSGLVAPGSYPLIDYNSIAGAGFSTFSLDKLPARMAASLVDNAGNTSIDVNVSSFDAPKWTGSSSADWDINGAQNWVLVNANTLTTYQEDLVTYSTADSVLFDDTAAGPTNVNVTTTVQPGSVTVNNSEKDYTFSGAGAIVGGGPLTKSGSKQLTIANTGGNALGVITVNGGTLQFGDGATAGGGDTTAGGIVNNAVVVINRPDASTLAAGISGAGELRHIGSGTTTLSGNSTYTGNTTISAGTVKVAGGNALGSLSSGEVNITAGGAVDIGGVTANDAGGSSGLFGAKQFNIAGDGPDGQGAIVNSGVQQTNAFGKVRLTADASIGGTARFDLRRQTPTLDLGGFTLTKKGTNQVALVSATVTAGNIVVQGGDFAIESATNIDASGLITYNDSTIAGFYQNSGDVSRPMVFNGNVLAGNSGDAEAVIASPWTLNGTVTLGQIDDSDGTFTLNGNISGPGGLVKAGVQQVNLQGSVIDYSGGTTVNAGTIITSTKFGSGPMSVNGGVAQVLAKGTANDPAGTTVVSSLAIAAGGLLDVTNNAMVVNYSGASPIDEIRQVLADGRLSSSLSDANKKLGYGEASATGFANGTFAGVSVDSDAVLIKYTYGGDSNLDGKVDVGDLGNLASNWQQSAMWTGGDFDYNGTVNVGDLGILATNWQQGVTTPTLGPSFAEALAALGLGGVSVPEPGMMGLLAAAGMTLARRRRVSR